MIRFVADQAKHRDRADPMRQIDLLLLEDAMRRGVIDTNATARSLQLAALLLVGACVLLVLVHDLAHRNASISAPPEKTSARPGPFAEYSSLSGSETYRTENCAGDYVCDADGPWQTMAGARTDRTQSWLTTTELGNAAHWSR